MAGDSNLVAGNVKSGVSIFGVSGSYAGDVHEIEIDVSSWSGAVSFGCNLNDRTFFEIYGINGITADSTILSFAAELNPKAGYEVLFATLGLQTKSNNSGIGNVVAVSEYPDLDSPMYFTVTTGNQVISLVEDSNYLYTYFYDEAGRKVYPSEWLSSSVYIRWK